MSDIKWIKVAVDMFEDSKIEFIRSLPEGDAIIVTWIQMLSIAGQSNMGGYLMVAEGIPYTEQLLSNKLRRQPVLLQFALETLTRLKMINVEDGPYHISKWEKHQNVEGMERVRLQTSERVKKHRTKEKEKLETLPSNATVTLQVTQCNATELELDLELDKEKQNTTTEFSPFIVLEKEYCKLHRKLDIHLKPKEIMAMEQLISGGVPLEFIVTNMKQMYQKKTEAGEKVTSFSYYSDAINDSWNNRNVMHFQTKKKDRFNDILEQWGEKKKNESTRND